MYIDRPKKKKKKKGNEIHIHRFGTSLRSIARLAKRRPSFTELTSRNTEEKGEEKKEKKRKKRSNYSPSGGNGTLKRHRTMVPRSAKILFSRIR